MGLSLNATVYITLPVACCPCNIPGCTISGCNVILLQKLGLCSLCRWEISTHDAVGSGDTLELTLIQHGSMEEALCDWRRCWLDEMQNCSLDC